MPTPYRRLMPALLVLGLVTGCSAVAAVPAPSPAPPADVVTGDLELPINAYRSNAWETGELILARALLIDDCLTRSGPRHRAAPDQAGSERQTRNRIADFGFHGNKRRYGVTSAEDARRYGHHLPTSVNGAEAAQPEKAPPGQAACAAEAGKTLALESGDAELARGIASASFTESLGNPRLAKAVTAWSGCMKAKGVEQKDPLTAVSAFDLNGAPTQRELATATADVACKQQTGVVETWREVETEYQNARIAEHQDELRTILDEHTQLMKRVAAVIAEH